MKTQSSAKPFQMIRLSAALVMALALWLLLSVAAQAAPLRLKVIGVAANGTQTDITATADYRWTVEQDATKASVPGRAADITNYSFSFHTSYMPVVAAGRAGTASKTAPHQDPDVLRLYSQALPDLDASKRYYVSVAAVGYQMGGAPVVFNGGTPEATVYLNQYELPTAQISVFAFNDNSPINGAPDLPQEQGLAGFTVKLIEAGGTFGQSGGEVTQDAFGNPLGTTYNADGTVRVRGSGIILTDANGVAVIKNLFPAKYTIFINPPVGSDWHQTSTIEGTKGSDAWVKNNEPQFFQEFGPPGHHVFLGFTRSGFIARNANNTPVLNGANAITGRIVNTHYSRPPIYTFHNGAPVNDCWVGLNETKANGGRALYAAACNKDSTFRIPNVPAGTYELVVWDEPLDMIIAATTITVPAGGLTMGDVPVASWFGRYQGRVFQDIDGTGLPYFVADFDRPYVYVNPITGVEEERQQSFKAGDLKPPFGSGIANNLRFRDGSIYQSTTTKDDGTFAFTEVFPFFNWLVAEIDYARFKATSANVVVDGGGPIDPAANRAKLWNAAPGSFGSNDPALKYDPWTRLNPQLQAPGECPEGRAAPCYFRTESVAGGPGAILLEGMQTFLGQTNHVEWGKVPYKIDENGGIAGIVYYGITRAEDDPRYAAAENWEPGIPRVQVNVFLDCDADGVPDKPKNDGTGECEAGGLSTQGYQYVKPDVDNYPFCWRDPASCGLTAPSKGPEDVVRGGNGTAFSYGDVLRWGAPGTYATRADAEAAQLHVGLGKTDSWDDSVPFGCPDPTPYTIPNSTTQLDCFDGLRNFNQVRPSVFDGGFAFGRVAGQAELPMIIGANGDGKYILEAVAPPGYLHQGNGDKNVVFGDSLKASPAALPHECVGMELDVPQFLTLFPGEPNPNFGNPQYPNNKWRKCDMKSVPLTPGLNAAPNFFMFTEAPVAGHGVGFILDDTAAEFNRFAPTFGEKFSPPHLPVSIQDWTGREISRVYSDQFGSYNFLVPSSFTINPPYPSGVMPSMMVACMNHAGPIKIGVNADGTDKMGIDPFFNRAYSQFCYTFQYLPGKTTYLDTPVLPVAAFAAVDKNPLDCECADGTPGIYSATNSSTDNGPWVPAAGSRQLTIVSMGKMDVINPAFDPADASTTKTIQRDYGFGDAGGSVTLGGVALTINSWADGIITATVPSGASTGQLMVRRGDNGKESVVGLTVHVGGPAPKKVNPNAVAGSGVYKTIQAAIDSVTDANMLLNGGALITVAPGTYNEYVIMDKRVRLQGWGAGSVTINAAKASAAGLADWRAKINAKASGPNATFTLLPGQTLGIDPANNEPLLFGAEEGPGILVVGRQSPLGGVGPFSECLFGNTAALHIDGLTITGADSGGGILASGYACGLTVSNSRILSNYGTYGGGVRIGHTTLTAVVNGADAYTDGVNRSPTLHHNWISQNGATEAGGSGGITLGTGSNNYSVSDNYVCGNFSMADGGGLSHLGRSEGSITSNASPANTIVRNKFIFNQTFNQAADPMGGGLSIAGHVVLAGGAPAGTGDVVVNANLIQGNQAGAGAGGGVSVARTLAADDIDLTNNMIVNNVAAYTGGGVALTGTSTGVRLVNNTVASNVSTATNRQAAHPLGWTNPSLPQVAGLAVLSGSSPTLLNNILWANRSYVYLINGTTSGLFNPGTTDVNAEAPDAVYADLGRIGAGDALTPRYSVLTLGGVGNATYDTGLTGCSNTAPAALPFFCNRLVAANSLSLFESPNDFLSIIDPTQPVVLPETTVLLQSALTFDETGNFINVIFSPLTLWNPDGSLRADYHLSGTSVARDNGRAQSAAAGVNATIGAGFVPAADFDANARSAAVDIGADEFVGAAADLSITQTDDVASVNAGGTLTYTITVRNFGPNAVTGATVTDIFPAALTVNSWTCTPATGSSCTVVGSGNNRTGTVTLTNGGSATFTANVTVAATASGLLTNTASVAVPGSLTDPQPSNNVATDTDMIVIPRPTLAVTDNFNRGNANTLGPNWQQLVALGNGGIRVNGNQAFCVNSGLAAALCLAGANGYWNGPGATFGSKQAASFTFANATLNNASLYLKATGTLNAAGAYPNALRVRYSTGGGGQVIVEATTNGGLSFTTAGSMAASFVSGDTLTALTDSSGFTYVWKTSGATTTLLGGAPTGATGAGRTGIFLPPGGRVDNFSGGTVP